MDSKKAKDLFERLIAYFDKQGVLLYSRLDVQVLDGKKNYFQAVALEFKSFTKEERPYASQVDDSLYICTQDADFGVLTMKALPEAWLKKFVEIMSNEASSIFGNPDASWPAPIEALKSNSLAELELKMGILGI